MNTGILRVIDANFNRAKEGLRVIEDIFRFIFIEDSLRRKVRSLRHCLDEIVQEKILKKAVLSRDSRKDIGKAIDNLELKRKDHKDILYINFQRVKESLRVLEEFSKLFFSGKTVKIKKMRYEIYILEKKALTKFHPVCKY